MVRPKNFDPEQALQRALHVFWNNGYRSTSLSELETALGIGRKSLYDTFGSKRELFLKALDAYATIRPPVENPGAGWEEIVESFGGGGPYDPEHRSCFFVNTIIELGLEDDPDVLTRIEHHVTSLREGFERALRKAIAEGRVPEQDPELTANYLCTALQGLSVMSRGGTSPEQLRSIAQRTLDAIQHP
ncbi:MAG: TetR/AcrR family transcriptional regulator [Myxococcota bacterium]